MWRRNRSKDDEEPEKVQLKEHTKPEKRLSMGHQTNLQLRLRILEDEQKQRDLMLKEGGDRAALIAKALFKKVMEYTPAKDVHFFPDPRALELVGVKSATHAYEDFAAVDGAVRTLGRWAPRLLATPRLAQWDLADYFLMEHGPEKAGEAREDRRPSSAYYRRLEEEGKLYGGIDGIVIVSAFDGAMQDDTFASLYSRMINGAAETNEPLFVLHHKKNKGNAKVDAKMAPAAVMKAMFLQQVGYDALVRIGITDPMANQEMTGNLTPHAYLVHELKTIEHLMRRGKIDRAAGTVLPFVNGFAPNSIVGMAHDGVVPLDALGRQDYKATLDNAVRWYEAEGSRRRP